MKGDWTPTTVGSFCPFAYGKGLPEKKRNSNGNIKVYGSNGPVGVHDQPLVNQPGIVIGRKGTVGAVHFVSEPFWPIDTSFLL
jgi:type I restriction enzyme, S subunit